MKNSGGTRRLAFAGLMCAIVTMTTMFVAAPIPGVTGAYVNIGDAAVYAAAYLLGWPWGAVSAAVGSALADLLLGSALYAPATFVIKGAMAALAARYAVRARGVWRMLGLLSAGLVMMAGYFGYECILYGSATALLSVPGNLMQAALGALLGFIVMRGLETIRERRD